MINFFVFWFLYGAAYIFIIYFKQKYNLLITIIKKKKINDHIIRFTEINILYPQIIDVNKFCETKRV